MSNTLTLLAAIAIGMFLTFAWTHCDLGDDVRCVQEAGAKFRAVIFQYYEKVKK